MDVMRTLLVTKIIHKVGQMLPHFTFDYTSFMHVKNKNVLWGTQHALSIYLFTLGMCDVDSGDRNAFPFVRDSSISSVTHTSCKEMLENFHCTRPQAQHQITEYQRPVLLLVAATKVTTM